MLCLLLEQLGEQDRGASELSNLPADCHPSKWKCVISYQGACFRFKTLWIWEPETGSGDFPLFDTSAYIDFAIHLSPMSHFSVSYFCVTVPNGLVSRSSICQHHSRELGGGGKVGWQGGWGPRERHQKWDAGLGPPPSTSPSHLYLSNWSLHLSVHDLELAVAGRNKGPTLVTNDNLRINTSWGGEGGAESLFHHPSASVALLINLWPLSLTLLWCLSLIFFLFPHLVKKMRKLVIFQ